ncbi:glycosyltransferase [Pseudokineococcus marinus]|uniref:Glycosyltransferase n=1 Tax=Pseudokineococcus marinus TaxID=351215 RepID=A0A849BWG0_9ACTN|nr:glycosyltransferase [Pseudokineococcus marinus]NNH21888.1 glycosyltransferase [Pseudokineococcus marinus]
MSGAGDPRVAVYRRYFLPRSETFVRDHLLRMPRYETRAVTSEVLYDPLLVPGVEPHLPRDRDLVPRAAAAVLRRLGRPPEQVAAPPLAAALRATGAGLVHVHFGVDAAWALPAVRLARLPLVVTFHGYDATMHPEVLRRSHSGALLVDGFDALVRRADAVVTVSRFLREALLRRGVPGEKIHVIACGVDVARAPDPTPPPEGPLLFVGRLAEKKGVGDLLEALAGLPGSPELVIAGDGPLRTELESRAAALRVRARFVGMRTSDEVADLMERASAVCLPSKTAADGDCEGLPVTALEAGLHGRALVGYAHSGIPEAVVDERTGLLAAEGDVMGLRARLGRLLEDDALRRRLGSEARAHVAEHFDVGDLLGRMADVYDGTLSRAS